MLALLRGIMKEIRARKKTPPFLDEKPHRGREPQPPKVLVPSFTVFLYIEAEKKTPLGNEIFPKRLTIVNCISLSHQYSRWQPCYSLSCQQLRCRQQKNQNKPMRLLRCFTAVRDQVGHSKRSRKTQNVENNRATMIKVHSY